MLQRVKPAVPLPYLCPDTVFQSAHRHADERERLMMRLAADCGMRRAKITVTRREDVFEDVLVWSLTVHGKGGKRRNVPITRGLAAVLRSQPCGYLFPGDEDWPCVAAVGRQAHQPAPRRRLDDPLAPAPTRLTSSPGQPGPHGGAGPPRARVAGDHAGLRGNRRC